MFFNVFSNSKEKEIFETINESLERLGYELIRIRLYSKGKNQTLQIMVGRSNGENVTVDDCEKASKHLSVLLDVHNLMPDKKYNLEISSPGIERPLTSLKELEKHIGEQITIQTWCKIGNQSNFTGILKSNDQNSIAITSLDEKDSSKTSSKTKIDFDEIREIYLKLNMKDILKKQK